MPVLSINTATPTWDDKLQWQNNVYSFSRKIILNQTSVWRECWTRALLISINHCRLTQVHTVNQRWPEWWKVTQSHFSNFHDTQNMEIWNNEIRWPCWPALWIATDRPSVSKLLIQTHFAGITSVILFTARDLWFLRWREWRSRLSGIWHCIDSSVDASI